MAPRRPVFIGNISGSTGDRLDGLLSMLGGPTCLDVIVGDWMSEANLASRSLQLRSGKGEGYEPGFLHSLRMAHQEYLNYSNPDLKIVVNAGGLNPKALAEKVQSFLDSKGSGKRVSYITGDGLLSKIDSLQIDPLTRSTGDFATWRKKYPEIIQANAYVGCWAITQALAQGFDIVICGRCTDASPIMGAAAWWHGWGVKDFNRLAGALAAGHLIECGCYSTGGNYAGFMNMGPHYYDLSYPIAAVNEDGTAVIQKQPGQNGVVNIDTLRGQLVYEIQGLYYYNPDVIADIKHITMQQVEKDQVLISHVQGIAPPETLKIAIMACGGYQAEFSVYITGLQARGKARSFERMARKIVDASKLDVLDFQLYGMPKEDPKSQEEATVQLRVIAQSSDPQRLTAGKFLGPMLSNQLQGYPGLTANLDYRTAEPKLICKYFPGLVDRCEVLQLVHSLEDPSRPVPVPDMAVFTPKHLLPKQISFETAEPVCLDDFGPTNRVPLGLAVYARSGDKGANANVGFFFPEGTNMKLKFDWLRSFLTVEAFRWLLAEDAPKDTHIERCEFPNIQAVHFVVHGHLGAGVSSSVKIDALGKNLAEYLRARYVDLPRMFLQEIAHM